MIEHWNTVIDYLAAQEQITEKYDLAILAGNSLPYLADAFIQLYEQGTASEFMIVGGIGHATPFLQKNLKNIGIKVSEVSETDMYLEYFKQKYHFGKELFLTETTSTNSGENARFSLNKMKKEGLRPKSVLLLEDPILQRRIKATFEKEWQETKASFTNYVPVIPYIKSIEDKIIFEENQLNGLWTKDYFLSLVLGEIPRLRNDDNGYGPKGMNYIGSVEIPKKVSKSYDKLCQVYEYRYKR
ncbi:YdcF family protein [Enterococcus plantarum]|uniref:YdcF family protein n=1 Tax=Enterococcus TaxID=1350 RepID=UPI001A901A21|nr:YdcF family protein [Enterococcus plantarum]MBO0467520.1 YdcF family protein [Enterococcus plantarum]